jgi:hypothetical protein
MVLVTNNWRLWLLGMTASLLIFAAVFFAVIKPSTDTANQAVKSGLQQTQQALNQAQKQVGSTSAQASSTARQSSRQIHKAASLVQCLTAAGTNLTAVQACHTKFSN